MTFNKKYGYQQGLQLVGIKRKLQMKDEKKLRNGIMSILTIGSLLLINWEMSIYRKTFISFLVPFSVFIIGGLTTFFFLRKRMSFYSQNEHNILLQAIHGLVFFGGIIIFSFMGTNFYFSDRNEKIYNLKIEKTGRLAKGRYGCGKPYAIVNYENSSKQLIFSCNTEIENSSKVKVSIKNGFFGFAIIKEMKPLYERKHVDQIDDKPPLEIEYKKILNKADEHFRKGNIEKSIELYERATTLRPNDKLPKLRLQEIKKQNTTNNR